MPGPKPIPTHLKILRGNPGHQKLNRNEPQPQIPESIPEPPALLTGYAAEEWRRIAPELHRLRLLTIVDVMPLAAYCVAYQRWRTAEETISKMAERDQATHGLLVRRADGNAGQNPLVRMASQAAEQMVSCAGHFGMSPAARARVSAGIGHEPPGGGPPSKFDGLLA